MRIALDAMGGDDAPVPNLEGALDAAREYPDTEILLVGDEPTLAKWFAEHGGLPERISLVPSDGWIGMEEKPTDALRRKPNCSIAVCWQLMASKQVEAVVSAGHTGAVVAAGLRTRLFLKGVRRPGIAVAMPTVAGRSVLMDVGANPAARPEHLVQYGVMGSIYAREILGIEQPRVGLMNIGSEDGKGTDLVRDAHALCSKSSFGDRYQGNVEGRDLYSGATDVVICEGFVGNVLLKAAEGMAEMLMKTAFESVMGALSVERQQAMGAFQALRKKFEYHEEGGAPLLGIDGTCMIAHGASDRRAIFNALRVARLFHRRGINQKIVEALEDDTVCVAN